MNKKKRLMGPQRERERVLTRVYNIGAQRNYNQYCRITGDLNDSLVEWVVAFKQSWKHLLTHPWAGFFAKTHGRRQALHHWLCNNNSNCRILP